MILSKKEQQIKDRFDFAKEQLLDYIPEGRIHPITQKDLYYFTGYYPRYIRKIIQSLRDDGVPICSTDAGYFRAEVSWELKETIKRLKNHRNTLSDTIEALEATYNDMKEKEGYEED